MIGLRRRPLDSCIVKSVIQHDASSRTAHHAQPIASSYAAGLLYRAAKRTLLKMNPRAELPIGLRQICTAPHHKPRGPSGQSAAE